ncbi:unnamed protein product [Phytophthora lilii]|uniref:Unnamed protein product n=1 Tax=Phytophthora lilii TaxID=2077276 RepID=A0A9W7DD10_9STRA|nr:unnamed protein product [Phytophthora lilii]
MFKLAVRVGFYAFRVRDFIRAITTQECASISSALLNGDDQNILDAVVYCTRVAEADGRKKLLAAKLVTPLVQLLEHDSDTIVIWSLDVLGNISKDALAQSTAVTEEAIPKAVKLLRTGTEVQRGFAAYLLGQLSSNYRSNSLEIEEAGAVPFLVGLFFFLEEPTLMFRKVLQHIHLAALLPTMTLFVLRSLR